jgi:hypothetical protein
MWLLHDIILTLLILYGAFVARCAWSVYRQAHPTQNDRAGFFWRFTSVGRGRRDGILWRQMHEITGSDLWAGKRLLQSADDCARIDYLSHVTQNTNHDIRYIHAFVCAYTYSGDSVYVKDAPLEHTLAWLEQRRRDTP